MPARAKTVVADGPRRRRWYQVGRLDAPRSVWANFLLVNLGFAGWLLWGNKSSDVATFTGGFVGSVTAGFGLSEAFGWIASSTGWRLCEKSQAATLVTFVLGAAGIFPLVAAGNALTNHAKGAVLAQRQVNATNPARPLQPFDVWERAALQLAVDDRIRLTDGEERVKLARTYLQGTMPADMVPTYERAIRAGVVPNPANDWNNGPMSLGRLRRAGELLADRDGTPHPPPGFVLDPFAAAPPQIPGADYVGPAAGQQRTPAEPMSHEQVVRAVADLHLQSIVHGGAYRACMINNVLRQEGGQVGSFTVQQINYETKSVVVACGNYRFELRMAK